MTKQTQLTLMPASRLFENEGLYEDDDLHELQVVPPGGRPGGPALAAVDLDEYEELGVLEVH